MIELSQEAYEKTRPLFEDIELYTPLPHCVIEKNQPGKIFADSEANPRAALICQQSGYYYVGGDSEAFADVLEDRLFSEIERDQFELSATPGFWESRLTTFMAERSTPYQMRSYTFIEEIFRQNSKKENICPQHIDLRFRGSATWCLPRTISLQWAGCGFWNRGEMLQMRGWPPDCASIWSRRI